MSIEQTIHVREVLLVRPAPGAAVVGHQKKITITTGAPVAIPDVYGEAEPLNPGDLAGFLDVAFVELVNERDALLQQLQAMTEDRNAKTAALAEAEATIASLQDAAE
ncbi:MAG: hypothetical protein ACOY5R_10665 [Pseudomonadota bacterium]